MRCIMGSLDTAIGISTQCWSPTGADTLLEIPRDSLPTLASNGTHHNLLLLVLLTYFHFPKHNMLYQVPAHTWNAFCFLYQPGELQSILETQFRVISLWLTPDKVNRLSLMVPQLLVHTFTIIQACLLACLQSIMEISLRMRLCFIFIFSVSSIGLK